MFAMIYSNLFRRIVNLRQVPKTVTHYRSTINAGTTASSPKLIIMKDKTSFFTKKEGQEGKGSGGGWKARFVRRSTDNIKIKIKLENVAKGYFKG